MADLFTASGTWTCPLGVTEVDVECWGGGAGGYHGQTVKGSAGSGGGAYAKRTIPVTPGVEYAVTVGAQVGSSTNGNPSSFTGDGGVKCEAVGGLSGNESTGGAGGSADNCTGDVKYSGGKGGNHVGGNYTGAGGGGEGAGTDSNGHDGQPNSGMAAGAGGTGGDGGDGGAGAPYTGGDPVAGSVPGGGGGAGCGSVDTPGAAGARGQVKITYANEHSYVGSIAAYPGIESTTKGRHRFSYVGSIAAYPGLASASRTNVRGRCAGSIAAYPGLASTTKGRHIWSYVGSIPAYPRLLSPTYNTIVLPSGETSDNPGTMDAEIPYDVIDFGFEVNHLGGMGVADFHRGLHIIDTADHNGVCSWRYQIDAKNTSGADQNIILKQISYTFDPDAITTQNVLTVTIPAGTTEWTLFNPSFTPLEGQYAYYWYVPDVVGLQVITGRPIVTQLGASETIVWRPLCNRGSCGAANDHMGLSWGTPDTWQDVAYGGTFYWDSTLFDADAISIVLEATMGSSYGGVVSGVRLWDVTAGQAVVGSSFTVTSGGAFRYPQSAVARHEFAATLLVDGHLYRMQFRRESSWGGGIMTDFLSSTLLGRAAFGIRLQGMRRLVVWWRVAKQTSGPVVGTAGYARARIRGLPGANSTIDEIVNETCSAADFFWEEEPHLDYWITDDGHLISGDAPTATDITDSNARQEPVAALLPIFSPDWKQNFIADEMYCQRVRPVTAGGDANAIWTLIRVAFKIAAVEWCVCPTITAELTLVEGPQAIRCRMQEPFEAALTLSAPEARRCQLQVVPEATVDLEGPEAVLQCVLRPDS